MLLLWKFCSYLFPCRSHTASKLSMREKRIQENNLLRRLPHHNLAALRVEPPLTFKKVFLYSCKGSNYIYF